MRIFSTESNGDNKGVLVPRYVRFLLFDFPGIDSAVGAEGCPHYVAKSGILYFLANVS